MGLRPYISVKDLAQVMSVSTKSVKRYAKQFDVPPTVNRHACVRWSFKDASRLLRAWENENNQPTSPYDT